MPLPQWIRQAVSALLVGVALTTSACNRSVSGAAQPVPRNAVPCDAAVMFVLDASLSMHATDVSPSRLTAAKQAAKGFADRLPPQTLLGLATFAGTAQLQVTPSNDRAMFKMALDTVKPSERSATGEGIFTALTAMEILDGLRGTRTRNGPHRIILLSDGKQTVPYDLNDPRGGYTAAREAKQKNVPISSISLGTDRGEVVDGGAVRVPVPPDPGSLREIARLSGGDFHAATSPDELVSVLDSLACHQ